MDVFLKTGKLGASTSTSSKPKDHSKRKESTRPWVEKYRPKSVDDVAYQDEVVRTLKKSLQGADLPNLLFYGPPGTGKTSTILAAARQLFGDQFRERVLELNASDERGIQVVRVKVKNFSQLTASSIRSDGRPCPPFKIVILDEADSMTGAAQAALRRTMEKHTRSTRFCLICNYVSRIIDPLTSRCSKFRFKPLAHDILITRLKLICEAEGVRYDDTALEALVVTSEGDMRKAITTLQSAHRLKEGKEVSAADINELTGVIPDTWLKRLLEVCRSNSYSKLEEVVEELMLEGYSAGQLMKQLFDRVIAMEELRDSQKGHILDQLATCDYRLMDGADEYLQMVDLGCVIMKQLS